MSTPQSDDDEMEDVEFVSVRHLHISHFKDQFFVKWLIVFCCLSFDLLD